MSFGKKSVVFKEIYRLTKWPLRRQEMISACLMATNKDKDSG